ncbi:DNA-binding MarR family transcriptional regulator [Lachnotalea glycerini]|uniref:MarR family transcriptional regulator n=1 Tax=Lachnotalea glycerini TaxID=1763509 RepID=A0A255IPJ7_9FIRM|nr:MarR family transcriptional regulator [Lachnotalea glycerini]PXV87776.1 DNA-binding MarR family transcriptional regulator [Lachnotalea glycerini]RDY32058.1 MarR family transcriptional regulator [Lachnotalea glycerini]
MNVKHNARFFGILNRQLQTYINLAFKKIGLNYWECIFLVNLYDNEGMNQEKLASILLIDKSIATKNINSLVNKGFIIRKINEQDKRAKNLYLTDKGKDYKEQIYSLIEKWIDYISDGIDKDTQDFVINKLHIMAEKARNADFNTLIMTNIDDEDDN